MKVAELILDLLRTYGTRGTSVQEITEAGALFGFTENSVRVNLSRLVSKATIEPLARGQYRICESNAVVNQFAESWRQGEARLKPWIPNTWLCIHTVKTNDKSKWALTNHGFRELNPGLWVRPDNLTAPVEQLFEILVDLGLSAEAIIIENAGLPASREQEWIRKFNLSSLQKLYLETAEQLRASLNRLGHLPVQLAKKESFLIGGQAIEVLAKDPLVPEQYLPSEHREALWQLLMEYDSAGREVWSNSNQAPDALITPNSKLMSV